MICSCWFLHSFLLLQKLHIIEWIPSMNIINSTNRRRERRKFITDLWRASDEVDKQPGAMGTSAGLALRLGQTIFSVGSVLFMCLDASCFTYCYAPFCFLVTTMGLVAPWSLGLAMIDAFLVLAKRPSNQPRVLSAVVLGDWVLSVLSLAVSCSTASVAHHLIASDSVYCSGNICRRYQLSAVMAFLTWILSSASLLFNLWLIPPLLY